jgi:hypothetical protein
LALELVDDTKDGGRLLVADAERGENGAEQTSIGHAGADVARRQPTTSHRFDRQCQELRIGGDVGFTDDVDVQLKMLAQTSALLSLVAEQLRNRKPADGFAQRVGLRGRHSRERRRHLRPERDVAAAFIGEVVQLSNDLVAALLSVQFKGF